MAAMLRDQAAGTRAKRCASQRDAPDRSAGVAKTGGVPSGPGFADRRGRGQDSSMSRAQGRGGSASAVPARGRATRGEAGAAKRRPCSALRQERLRLGGLFCWRHWRYPALRACGVAVGGALHGLARGLLVEDFAADHFVAMAGAPARAGLCAPDQCVLAPRALGRGRTQHETPPVAGRQRHRSLRA